MKLPIGGLPRLQLLVDSYQRLTGRPLLNGDPTDLATALWHAPRVVVAHGTQADPVFFYGNALALQAFEMEFAEFVALPSRFSAEPVARAERAALLARVSRDGFIDDYAGVRISARGRRFQIEQAVVWNLIDADGLCHGQAASFAEWRDL